MSGVKYSAINIDFVLLIVSNPVYISIFNYYVQLHFQDGHVCRSCLYFTGMNVF